MKVRILYFSKAKIYDPADYPEQIVEMTEEEFDDIVEASCYYDEIADMYYVADNSIGYEILEY